MRTDFIWCALFVSAFVPLGAVYSAEAELKGKGISGKVSFAETGAGVKVSGVIDGLSPGSHGFHIHEKGDCSAEDFSSAGAHFNPTGSKHGNPSHGPHHAGDLGNILAPEKGSARHSITVPLGLEGPDSIVGRSVVVHEKADDLKTDPSGNSGARIACGVIE